MRDWLRKQLAIDWERYWQWFFWIALLTAIACAFF
jgi:hypothetical protein